MRFMMLMYPGPLAETGAMPSDEKIASMMKYNEELAKSGVLLAGEGLHPSSQGARITFAAGKPTVVDGPFTESKELLGGFWMLHVKSKAEAVAWASRCPADDTEYLELRRVFDPADFGPEVEAQENALLVEVQKTADKLNAK